MIKKRGWTMDKSPKNNISRLCNFIGSWVFLKTTPFLLRDVFFLFNEKSPQAQPRSCWRCRVDVDVFAQWVESIDHSSTLWTLAWNGGGLDEQTSFPIRENLEVFFFFKSYFCCVGEVEVGRCFSCETEFWRGEVWNLDAIKGRTHFIQWIERVMQESSC